MTHQAVAVLVAACIGAVHAGDAVAQPPPPVPAQPAAQPLPQPADQVALAHFNAGNAAFRRAAANPDPAIQRTEYQDAAKEYLAAVRTESKYLYTVYWNLGQAYRALGEYTRATHFYMKFLEFTPARYAAQRTAAEDHIRTMAAELDKNDALDGADPTSRRGPAPLVPPNGAVGQKERSDEARERPRWYRDTVGWTLVGSGVAASLVGGGLFQSSSSLFDQAADEDRQSVQADLDERARLRRGLGVVTGALGIACVATGVIKLSITGSPTDRGPQVGVTIGASSLFVHGSF